ncbi:hypothetical protein TASIC1_0010029700 [Trichoderma asperellum]|uniref:Uncharacterized protein n=1 Tax=Trichoderma asperellum TaxID=101201 RepID=A0A6V8R323_TRIAP|nr:hypothetical protein TASIC1_0010029700 [Trichoderma asperellum]
MMSRYGRQSERSYYRHVVRRQERRRSYGVYEYDSDESDGHDHDHDHDHDHGSDDRNFYAVHRPGNGHVSIFEEEEQSGPQLVCFYTSSPNAIVDGCRAIPCTTDIPGWRNVLAPTCINGQYVYPPLQPPVETPKPFTLRVIDHTNGKRWRRYGESYVIEVSPLATGHDIASWILSCAKDIEENEVFVRWDTGLKMRMGTITTITVTITATVMDTITATVMDTITATVMDTVTATVMDTVTATVMATVTAIAMVVMAIVTNINTKRIG